MQCGMDGPCNTTGHEAKSREHRLAARGPVSDNPTSARKSFFNPTKGRLAPAGTQNPPRILLPGEGMG